MRLATLLLAVLTLVPAGAAATVRAVSTAAPVVALAMDGRRIAYAESASARDCDRVRVWNLSTRGVTKLGRSTACVKTSTGTGIASLAIAGTRVLWLHYTGGNIREWRLYTATTTATRPRRLAFIARDVDARQPIVVGNGDTSPAGDLLPYAIDRDVTVLRADGSRRFTWRAPAPVLGLAASDGRVAVASAGGLVTVLDATGTPVGSEQFAADPSAVALAGKDVLVQRGRTLELRRDGSARTFTLPSRSTLEDASADRAFFVTGGQARQLSLSSGAQRLLALGSHVEAELTTAAVASGRRVTARQLPPR